MSLTEIKKSLINIGLIGLIGLICLPVVTQATDYSSSNFTVKDSVIDSGTSSSSSSNFGLGQSLGQTAIGKSTSASFQLWSGFQYFFKANSNTLTATPGNGQVSLSWTAPITFLGATAASYEVGTGIISGSYTFEDVGAVTSFIKPGLTNGTTYYFIVKAKTGSGAFLIYSNEASAIPAGGGGGGGGASSVSLIVSGQAYPLATVSLVYDATTARTVVADATGRFYITVSSLPPGNYVFIVRASDLNGNRSSHLTFDANIASGITVSKSGLLLSPTIHTDYALIKQGETLNLTGFGPPTTPITIMVDSDTVHLSFKTTTNINGRYQYGLNTANLPFGRYQTYAYANFQNIQSPDSPKVSFTVSDRSVLEETKPCTDSDLNCDERVDLVDFSILLYFWEGAGDLQLNPRADIDRSGAVDLVDFSIMLFNWTG